MAVPANLRVDIIGDSSSLQRSLRSTQQQLRRFDQSVARTDTALGNSTRQVGKTSRAFSRMGSMVKVGAGLLAGIGISAVVNFGRQAVQAASNVEQAMGAVDSVFKNSAQQVQRWASTAASSVGLAKAEYGDLASVLGAQLQGMGFEIEASAKQTRTLITLGADLAATFGGTTKDAVQAISSLLRGERDPIERYGVSLKQADINARIVALGLDTSTAAAEKQANAMAALQLLTEQTASAQGQFARESDTLAVRQQKLAAEWENSKATLGNALLPALVTLARVITQYVMPLVTRFYEWISGTWLPMWGRVKDAVVSVNWQPLVKALRTLWDSIQQGTQTLSRWWDTLTEKTQPFVRFLSSTLKPTVRDLQEAFTKWRDTIVTVWKAIQPLMPVLKTLGVILGVLLVGAILLLIGTLTVLARVVAAVFNGIMSVAQFLWTSWATGFGAMTSAVAWVVTASQNTWDSLTRIFNGIVSTISGATDRVVNLFTGLWGRISAPLNSFKNSILGVFRGIQTGIKRVVDWIRDRINDLKSLASTASSIIDTINPFSASRVAPTVFAAPVSQGSVLRTANLSVSRPSRWATLRSEIDINALTPEIRVYIGDKELTDMVKVEIGSSERTLARRIQLASV